MAGFSIGKRARTMATSLPRVVIKPRRARLFFARHPWVFVNSIDQVEGDPEPGDEVRVVSHDGQFIARGLFSHRSAIRVRLYRWTDDPIDDPFLAGLLTQAIQLRTATLNLVGPGTATHLVLSEGDGISGLTVDRFDRTLAVQITSLVLDRRRDFLVDTLLAQTGVENVILRGEKGIPAQEGLKVEEGWLRGKAPDGPIEITDGGVWYAVDLATGQKTGFYLDQRDNRRAPCPRARRGFGHLFLLRAGRSRGLRRHPRPGGGTVGAVDPDPRTARAGGRPPGLGVLPGNRVPQMRDGPGRLMGPSPSKVEVG